MSYYAKPEVSTSQEESLYEAIDSAIMESIVIVRMEGEYHEFEYRRMADLEADGDAIALCDYRKQCRRQIMSGWFTTVDEVEDYVEELKHPPKKRSALFSLVAELAKPVQL